MVSTAGRQASEVVWLLALKRMGGRLDWTDKEHSLENCFAWEMTRVSGVVREVSLVSAYPVSLSRQ